MTTDTFVRKLSSHYYEVYAPRDAEEAISAVPGVYRATYREVPGCFYVDIIFTTDVDAVIKSIVDVIDEESYNQALKPCPFCASKDVVMHSYIDYPVHRLSFQIVCENCGAVGPNELHPERAKVMWNLRRL